MKGLLRSVIVFVLVIAFALTIYRMFGGDLAGLLLNIWGFLYSVIEGVATVFGQILSAFGIGK